MSDSTAGTGPAVGVLDRFRLDGRVAIVTGASSGLGERFARVLREVGATVVVAARRLERLEALAASIGAHAIRCDVSLAADRERLVSETVERFGTVDVLVNNAGVTTVLPIEAESLELFEHAIQIDLVAVWHLSKLVGEHMVAQRRGSIVNIASILGLVSGSPVRTSHYAAAKGAVVNLSRELATQWARKGVRVNSLCPGWIHSEMTAGMNDEGSKRYVSQNCPLDRMGDAHELDGALLLLASDAGSYMTGATVVVDGGWTAR